MPLRHYFVLCLFALPFLLQNCAQVAQPPGGKKDTIAPQLITSIPKQRALNYAGQTVVLEFDEYVKSENIQQKITITPQDSNTFVVKELPNGLRLTFNRPLQKNTTYTINFSDGIRDITERNVAKDAKVVFSTGSTIDSLSIGGTVTDDESRQPILGFVVGLFGPNDTLPINRKRPAYYARTDSSGRYLIENIKSDRYKVYGFEDKDLNLVNNTPGERVAFRDSIIDLTRNYSGIDMVAFRGTTKPRISRRERTDETLGLELSSGIASYSLTVSKKEDTLISFLESPKMIRLFRPADRAAADTVNIAIATEDSVGNVTNLKERVYFSPLKTRAKDRKPLAVAITPTNSDPVDRNLNFTFAFNKPVLRYDTTLINIGPDTLRPLPLKPGELTWTNSFSRLVLEKPTNLRDTLYLQLEMGAFISVQGDTLPRYTARYFIADEDSYGLLAGRISQAVVADTNFIVELLNDKYEVVRSEYGKRNYEFARLKPGRYRVRLIMDRNGNRRRDTGNIEKGIQPEAIIYHPGADEDGFINLRQNFELTDIDF